MPRREVAAHVVYCLLVLALLANGLYFWLQKSQIIPSPAYEALISLYESYAKAGNPEDAKFEIAGFHAIPIGWLVTKFLKDFFILVFAIVSCVFIRLAVPPVSRWLIMPALFGATVCAAFFYSLSHYGPWVALAGLRPIAYLVAGFIGFWIVSRKPLQWLGAYLVFALAAELLMAVYESSHGLILFASERAGNRASGTFSFPTALGIFAATVFMYAYSFSVIKRPVVLALAVALVYLTGSATALFLLLLACAIWIHDSVSGNMKKYVRLASVGALAIALLALPKMVSRPDVMDSLWGRIEPLSDYLAHLPPDHEIWFGKGLGIGSNVVTSIVARSGGANEPAGVDLFHARSDSTLLALVNQVGLAGAVMFYLWLIVAAVHDRRARPVYIILIPASLATHLLELFPVNFLLGVLLCHSWVTLCSGGVSAREQPSELKSSDAGYR